VFLKLIYFIFGQSSEMFDNLNTLLLDIFKESRLSGEPYICKIQEIEAVSLGIGNIKYNLYGYIYYNYNP